MTKYKSCISTKRNSSNRIPLKYQSLVDNLGNIENVRNIDIFFDDKLGEIIGVNQPGWNNKRLKGDASDLSTFIELMKVSYSPHMESSPINKIIELSAWSINLRGCVKDDTVKVRELLVDVILPIIKRWFNERRTDVWYINRQNLQVGINEKLSKYCLLETQENNIIRKDIKDI